MIALSPWTAAKLHSSYSLVGCRNPRPVGVIIWTGYAGTQWAWPKAHSLLFLNSSCAATPRKGGSSEQISQVITYHMALSVSHRMGSQIPFSGASVEEGIQAICGYASCEVVEMNVRRDHVHLIVMIPPKLAISDVMGRVKGQTAINTFKQFRNLRKKPYWGNHFWSPGYCVDIVGLDSEMIQKYVRYQEQKERQMEQLQLGI